MSDAVETTPVEWKPDVSGKWPLAFYKAGENLSAFWLFKTPVGKPILVQVNLRCHGHGELYLTMKRVGDTNWVDLVDGTNVDFGRVCDRMVQKVVQPDNTKDLDVLAKLFGRELVAFDEALDFQQWLANWMHEPLYQLKYKPEPDEFMKKITQDAINAGRMTAEQAEQFLEDNSISYHVMMGPDKFEVPFSQELYDFLDEGRQEDQRYGDMRRLVQKEIGLYMDEFKRDGDFSGE